MQRALRPGSSVHGVSYSAADEGATTLTLSRVRFVELLGGDLGQVTRRNLQLEVVSRVKLFETLDAEQLETIVGALREVRFGRGEAIVREGDAG